MKSPLPFVRKPNLSGRGGKVNCQQAPSSSPVPANRSLSKCRYGGEPEAAMRTAITLLSVAFSLNSQAAHALRIAVRA
jgi:hypothetical protein